MKVEMDKTFPIDASVTAAWRFLQDIPGVASCMPGAEIIETIDDQHYKGKFKVKIGPATMAFNGDIEIKDLDVDRKQLHMIGRGQDTKGSSSAEMDLTAMLVDSGDDRCELQGKSMVSVTGKAASLGGRMMNQVSDQIINQFGKNFSNHVLALGQGDAADSAKEALAEQPRELNALAMIWSLLVGLVKGLFGRKPKTG